MNIEDVFAIRGRGTVVVGQIESGTLQIGDVVKIETQVDTLETIVTGIEKFRRRLKQASAGENVGVLLRDVAKEDLQRGDVLIGTGDRRQF
ncbi:MAG: EF-Tu/IF-2/RF-3 family GTPase [Anaerolineae bacterium]|jgi:elongation factor Tu